MKYKIGDKVRIKSLDWYNKNKGNAGKTNSVWCKDDKVWFFYHMSQYCGKIMTIIDIWESFYILEGSGNRWTDEMIECKVGQVEEDKPLCESCHSLELKYDKLTIANNICTDKVEIILQDYELKQEGDKWFAVKKKKEYPKNYKECCGIMGFCSDTLKWDNPFCINRDTHPYIKHLDNLIGSFCKLLICRDAYWKIAGEEMGLGKPWEPDWTSTKYKYCITTRKNKVEPLFEMNVGFIFAFPTEKMRDAFKENFDKDLEFCKELL